MKETIKPQKIQAEKMIGHIFHRHRAFPSDKDSIMYSLAVGLSQGNKVFYEDPLRKEDFKFTNETDGEFCALPTFATVAHELPLVNSIRECPFIPELDQFAVLHGEQKLTMIKERLELGREYEHVAKFIDVIDKGKGVVVWYEIYSYLIDGENRELAFVILTSIFIKGHGDIGYQSKNVVPSPPKTPKRNFDKIIKVQTYPNQAFLYRLTGDRNALHVNPEIAKKQKFPQPIIHGMATYGTVAKTVIQELLGNDETRLETFYSRFVGFVLPGETILLQLWNNGENGYIYEAFTEERQTKVLVGEFKIRPEAKL